MPELCPRRRPPEQMAVMMMPEAPIHENDGTIPGEHKIRLARQVRDMEAVTPAHSVEGFAHDQFRFGIAAPDRSHVSASCWGIMNVGQSQAALRRCEPSSSA